MTIIKQERKPQEDQETQIMVSHLNSYKNLNILLSEYRDNFTSF